VDLLREDSQTHTRDKLDGVGCVRNAGTAKVGNGYTAPILTEEEEDFRGDGDCVLRGSLGTVSCSCNERKDSPFQRQNTSCVVCADSGVARNAVSDIERPIQTPVPLRKSVLVCFS
jgi:hypothetical protein